jgi:hypothetical protein
MVDNIESTIQMGGHTPRVVFLDIGAQPVILESSICQEDGHVRF